MTFAQRLLVGWKWVLSFRKRDWGLLDYPIVLREWKEQDPIFQPPRFSPNRFDAYTLGWHVLGGGDSPEAAKLKLAENFASVKRNRLLEGKPLPRPGVSVPVEFASQERVDAHPELADDFIRRVLEYEWAFISDESSLWDFHTERSNDAMFAKVLEVDGVDVSDIESGRVWIILDRIAAARQQ